MSILSVQSNLGNESNRKHHNTRVQYIIFRSSFCTFYIVVKGNTEIIVHVIVSFALIEFQEY